MVELYDMDLDKLGRLTEPMVLREDSNHYERISWDDAFAVSTAVRNLEQPNEAVLYTSGRASNEAAFLWGTLSRQMGRIIYPIGNMCLNQWRCPHTIDWYWKRNGEIGMFNHADLVLVIGQTLDKSSPNVVSVGSDQA